ncbi:MAG: amino acid adenylation domain-containing protein [Cyanobium sp. PLM2.Bin73]|nr:MAG: amino acid adenylation domain-containing protein [Cyanobium sp. PLM2.Bin73]
MGSAEDRQLNQRRQALSAAKRELLERRLRGETGADPADAYRLEHRDTPLQQALPTSFAQRRLWLLQQLADSSADYTIPVRLSLTPTVEPHLVEQALNAMVSRHESLRTSFRLASGADGSADMSSPADISEGDLVQVVAPRLQVPLAIVDLRQHSASQRQLALVNACAEQATKGFDLSTAPLLNAALVWLGQEQQLLLLSIHHLIADGWSLQVLLSELEASIEALLGKGPSLPPPVLQYSDYIRWQQRWLASDQAREQAGFWQRQLADLPHLDLPVDQVRPVVASSKGSQQALLLPPPVAKALRRLALEHKATLFMLVLAAWAAVLARYSGQGDFGIGVPVAGRTRSELEGVIGLFLNTVVIRCDLCGNPSFEQILSRIRLATLQALDHQALPFEQVLRAVQPSQDPGQTPLFRAFFNALSDVNERLAEHPFQEHVHAPFDLSLYSGEAGNAIPLALVYRSDCFSHATATGLLNHLGDVLEHVALTADTRLAALPLRAEDPPLPAWWTRVTATASAKQAAGWEQGTISERFQRQVALHPEREAVCDAAQSWSYAELERRSDVVAATMNGLAHGLDGARPPVALLFNHEVSAVAAVLGTLKAGLAYIPLDGEDPDERLRFILQEAKVERLLCSAALSSRARALMPVDRQLIVWEELPDQLPYSFSPEAGAVSPESLAYVLYTSGSTGHPKGVMQAQRQVLGHAQAYALTIGIQFHDRLSLLASLGVDAAVMDLYGALLNGACLCLFDGRGGRIDDLPKWLADERITIYHSTPSLFRHLALRMEQLATEPLQTIHTVVLGGEQALRHDHQLFQDHFPEGCRLVNGLGPSECSLAVQHQIKASNQPLGHALPIGQAVPGLSVALLDPTGAEITGVGVGELEMRGSSVALGYLGQERSSASPFRPLGGSPPRRAYRSGDLARRRRDGLLEFVGRRDNQVKIRGHRVELAEIETLLNAQAGVKESVVVLQDQGLGPRLVAYVATGPDAPDFQQELMGLLRRRLPGYMVPAQIVPLSSLPKTVSGKLDRRQLPAVQPSQASANRMPEPPRNAEERALVQIWREVLMVSKVDIHDNFFALGGHSLLAVQMISRLRQRLGVELALRQVFETPCLAELAKAIAAAQRCDQPPIPTIPRQAQPKPGSLPPQ